MVLEDEKNLLRIGPLTVQIRAYEFPESDDYWDANWLIADIQCADDDRLAKLVDPCLRTSELSQLRDQILGLFDGSNRAEADCMEPYFDIKISRTALSSTFDVSVVIWPDSNKETEEFRFKVLLDSLQVALEQLEAILKAFPVREFNDVH